MAGPRHEVFFRTDVLNRLRLADQVLAGALRVAGDDDERVQAYRSGFEDALRAIGDAFDVSYEPTSVTAQVFRHALR